MSSWKQLQEEEQELHQELTMAASLPNPSPRLRAPRMPSDNLIRNSIARNLTQILLNMRNADCQQKCSELLQVEDLAHGTHIKILAALEYIDAQLEERERVASDRKQRKANK